MRALLLCLTLAGCLVDLDVTNQRPLTPLPEFEVWHAEVEVCIGRERAYADIRWYQADYMLWQDTLVAGGFWRSPDVIIIRSDRLWAEHIVKHEVVHYVRQNTNHNARQDRCASEKPSEGE